MNRQQRVAHVVAFVVIAMSVLAVPAIAQDCPELVSRWPYGPTSRSPSLVTMPTSGASLP